MVRVVAIVAVLVAFPASSFAANRPGASTVDGLVTKVVSCDVTTSARSATFYGRMDSISGALKMQMRFQLYQRLGRDDTFSRVDVPALRPWHGSQAGVKRFGWKQTVDGLRNGGAYKARIQFRWLAPTGDVLDTETRDTPVCRGPLPNIVVGNVTTKPGPTSDTRTYKVDIQNDGKVDADAVDVQLSVDKAILDTLTINSLDAGDTRSVSFTGPICKNSIRVYADPGNTIGETLEDDNSQRFACG